MSRRTNSATANSGSARIERPWARILIIEDDHLVSESLTELMRLTGLEAIPATNGFSGLDLAERIRPDCILVDLRLPDMDGYVLLRRLKSHIETRHIPVIVLSGFSQPDHADLAIELGAAVYIKKPYGMDMLKHAISKVINGESPDETDTNH